MYSSNGNKIGNDPISYSDQPFLQRPFLNDIISSSKQADSSPLSFFQFPSPFEDEGLFPQQHCDPLFPQPPSMRADYTVTETVVHMAESNENHINRQIVAQQIPRKRSSKRDRHSKINTARGPRDRRMRLSLEVARKFFGLQDMLGYDKASKTVEWLLVQAKAEIKKLARETKRSCSAGTKSASSTSECEVASAVHEVAVYYGNQVGSVSEEKPSRCATKEKKIRQWRNCAFHPLAKESREKARARARERTREKMKNRKQDETKLCEEATNCDLSRLGSWSPFETGEESGTQSHNMNPSLDVLPEIEEGSSRAHDRFGAAEDMVNNESLVFITTWSPSMIFSSLNNPGISYEHQLAELHSFGKSWEA